MPTLLIDTDILSSRAVEAYLARCDHRIKSGFRLALEALGIAVPHFAARLPSGPKPGQGIIAAFAADAAIHGDTVRPSHLALNLPHNASTPRPTNELPGYGHD